VALPVAEAVEPAGADPVEVACNGAVDQAEVACNEEADPAVACNVAKVGLVEEVAGLAVVEAWNAVAVDLAADFRKAPPAICSEKAQQWVLMAARG
jgi:hypothetical protein